METAGPDKLFGFISKLKLELIIGVIGLFLVVGGIFAFSLQNNKSADIEIKPASSSASIGNSEIMVDVSGAVVRPGVYKVANGSRVGQAIETAGGFENFADQAWIAKSLNLAAKLNDGAKIYIPKIGENSSSQAPVSVQGSVASVSTININSASQGQLEDLPGIGPVTAVKIINARPYGSTEELLTRKIVSASVYEKIKGLVSTF